MNELERPALVGRVASPPDEAAEAMAAEAAEAAAAIGVMAYRGMDHVQRLIDGNKVLQRLHGPRDVDACDIRCRTCRTSRGRAAPWPCDTLVQMSEALGLTALEKINIEEMRDVGRVINGIAPHTEAGRKLWAEMRPGDLASRRPGRPGKGRK